MQVKVTGADGKTLAADEVAGVFFFNGDTFGDPIDHYTKSSDGSYEPGQDIIFVNVNLVATVTVQENADD